jgi:hypothetical protein
MKALRLSGRRGIRPGIERPAAAQTLRLLPAVSIPWPAERNAGPPTRHGPHLTLTPMALPARYARRGQPVAPLRDIFHLLMSQKPQRGFLP